MVTTAITLAILACIALGVMRVRQDLLADEAVAAREEVVAASQWWTAQLHSARRKCKSDPAILQALAPKPFVANYRLTRALETLFRPVDRLGIKLGDALNRLIDWSGLDRQEPRHTGEAPEMVAFRTALAHEIARFSREHGSYPLLVLASDGSMPCCALPTYRSHEEEFNHEESVLSRALRNAGFTGKSLLHASGLFPTGVVMEMVPADGHPRLSTSGNRGKTVLVRGRSVYE